MNFYQHTLENGLTVIGEQSQSAVSTAVGFFTKTGARDETPELAGVSHFLEHMMFKGTEKRSALDVTYALGSIGAQANAYTSEEQTVYYSYLLPEYLEQGVDILSDMLRPALDEKEFDLEKGVILEEIALYQDRPSFLLFERALQEYFKGHTAGNPVLGTVESVSGLSREMMKEYFDRRYVPSNMVMAVSGSFDWKQVQALAERYCGHWEARDAGREVRAHQPQAAELSMQKENLQMAHFCVMSPGPSATDDRRYSAHLLGCILGDSVGSKTYWELIDKGLAESASVEVDEMEGTGVVYGYVSGETSRIEEISDTLCRILENAKDFADEELERAKTKIATRIVLQSESFRRRLMAIGNEWLYRGSYSTPDEELERVKAVSRESIEEMLEEFSFEPKLKVTLLPQ